MRPVSRDRSHGPDGGDDGYEPDFEQIIADRFDEEADTERAEREYERFYGGP